MRGESVFGDVKIGGAEIQSVHLDSALLLAGAITVMLMVYQLYKWCVMRKAAKEMNEGNQTTQRSSHAVINGQVVY